MSLSFVFFLLKGQSIYKEIIVNALPGGPGVKNLSCNAGDMV